METQSLCHYFECCRRANDSDIALNRDFRTGLLSDVKGDKNRIRTVEAEIQRWIKQEGGGGLSEARLCVDYLAQPAC